MTKDQKKYSSAHIIAVDMGYGHERAVNPLRDIADGGIMAANTYQDIPAADRRIWRQSQSVYERISRLKHIPLFGAALFGAMDYVQRIEPFYPKRDLSKPHMQTREMYRYIRNGWGKHLIARLNAKPLPLITSFFTVAFFAEEHGYNGPIYAICTDTDVSRAWAPLYPKKTRITYCAPNRRVKERLLLYGVPERQILVTGFPLPKENIGDNLEILKNDLSARICRLDPAGKYRRKYARTLEYAFGGDFCPPRERIQSYTLTFAVGGAGAQRELGGVILSSLRRDIISGRVRMRLVAGTRADVRDYFIKFARELNLTDFIGSEISIIYAPGKSEYFAAFNAALRTTDVLWTKPSELSFYAGLGIPIIMAPTIGSQEEYNKSWLFSIGAGVVEDDPRYVNEWLWDWMQSGWLAEAAMNGFMDAPRNGTYHIEDVALRGIRSEIEDVHLL